MLGIKFGQPTRKTWLYMVLSAYCKRRAVCIVQVGKNVEFPLIENIFSEFFEKLKVSDYYRKSESFRLQREI